ncbi:MAG: LysR family transcriptional regulator, partial [Pseudomonadota bacterium]
VDNGSLSGAARALKTSQPTISRQIAELEEALDLTLFERSTRALTLTDQGQALVDHTRTMADAAAQISRVALGHTQTIAGTVKITCSDGLAATALPSILVALQRLHPDIRIDLAPSNEISNLTRRDADIAIRHMRPDQPDLIAKRLKDIHVSLFAAPDYLARLGPLSAPQDLAKAAFVGFGGFDALVPQLAALGLPVTASNIHITTTTGPALAELVRVGAGIGLLPAATAQTLGLAPVPHTVPAIPVPTWLVTHREIHTSPRIRVTFDHLAEHLSALAL